MREINFITIGDKNFFPLIHFSIKQVLKFYPTSKLFIYDWGFTPYQKKKISTYPNTILINWTDKLDRENGYKTIRYKQDMDKRGRLPRKREYILSQKPVCILDCANRIKENLIFFDGDVILINPIDEIFEDNYDIGLTINVKVTAKHKNISKGPYSWIKGVNSGVIFFNLNSKPMQIFIQEWINEIKTGKGGFIMEQTALINLIRKRNKEIFYKEYNIGRIKLANLEYRIKTFPITIYNWVQIGEWYNDKKVKFLHFITMKYYNPNLSKSLIIRYFIREIKIHYAIHHILKLISPILSSKVKNKISKIIYSTFKFKLIIRPFNFKLIILVFYTVILNIIQKKQKKTKKLIECK